MEWTVRKVFQTLDEFYDSDEWWPSESVFEIMIGAILTQRVSWKNVQMALDALRRESAIDPKKILEMDDQRLHELIRPSGFYRQKSRYLKTFSEYVIRQYGGDFTRMKEGDTKKLRNEMLSLEGIGRETADTMLLYGLGHPSFIVDAYAFRLFRRLNLDTGRSYDAVKDEVETAIGLDAGRLAIAHAQVVTHCKTHCLATPMCHGCPFSGRCLSETDD